MTAKLYGGGGEGVVHSSVPPWNGSGPDGGPRNLLHARLAKIISSPAARMNPPIVSARLYASQPNPAWYVSTPRVIPSSPTMCIGKNVSIVPRKVTQNDACAQRSWYMRPVTFGNQ